MATGTQQQNESSDAGREASELHELLSAVGDRIDELAEMKKIAKERGDHEMEAFFDGRLREAQWMNNLIYEKAGKCR